LLGRFALAQGDATGAGASFEESLTIFEALGLQSNIAQVLSWLAGTALALGEMVKAVMLCQNSLARFFDLFTLFTALGERVDYEQLKAAVQAELGEQAWALPHAMLPPTLSSNTTSSRCMIHCPLLTCAHALHLDTDHAHTFA
jgi:hypothetical protein